MSALIQTLRVMGSTDYSDMSKSLLRRPLWIDTGGCFVVFIVVSVVQCLCCYCCRLFVLFLVVNFDLVRFIPFFFGGGLK